MSHVTIDAPVKVNLHLGIHPGRDSRGYHRADSVMVALGVGDTVTVSALPGPPVRPAPASRAESPAADASGVLLAMSEDVGVPPQKNTAWQAAARLRRAFGIATPVRVEVCKAVPPQSGLGGSSSDAASVILALCRLFSLDEKDPRIVDVARSVGADVPFFLNLAPSYLTGAGDVLAQTFPVLEGLPVVLVRPAAGVSTVAAYREFDAEPVVPASPAPMLAALRDGDAMAVAAALYNNLEGAATRLVPEILRVKSWLQRQTGAVAAQVTGSGSCVFAICETHAAARAIAARAQDEEDWWSSATFTVGKRAHFC
ncbi:4-(cytidine 5'-diphospho)-2-C-methyl-D-erythritol kinase [Parafannyhessea umbonata]|uniref:4-(cytidine 5'-diphospho)-2-C-methyl-D-erythritol kinase n=1 Tax=Parafannyhessea umbonata TaxID=604330 RepID=UPI0026EA0A27|nr:4-(cytidine 5'-diphospho)-2-C-methyl-D-erythritol kinase [Parafannyhessea umbonata]MDD7199712.1 4-(cytidine 5'-diphospho)-2-C-methyl-D-erythritol kinase [Parafannyhessea umbonata]MDY4418786.1 4-(cytidine 5'-diphospho)-2-C-methyl-D-erythritol kinase [Parafannyhessea umbonata]